MVRSLYSLLFTLLLPFILLRLFVKSIHDHRYRQRVRERFGNISPLSGDVDIWLHAVSVGEVSAASPLIDALLAHRPDCRILLTTTTPTGFDRARALLSERVIHRYAPLDHPLIVRRFLNHAAPRLLIIMERELWPNIISICIKKSIGVVIANARLSKRAQGRYAYILPLMRPALTSVSAVGAQTTADKDRLLTLGTPLARTLTTGNMKYEVAVPDHAAMSAQKIRATWGAERLVVVAGSTHNGEEVILLETLARLRRDYPQLILIIAPRHSDRFDTVFRVAIDQGFETHRHGGGNQAIPKSAEVLVHDTMGQLPVLYAAADIAVVGGSLIKTKGIGGHNLLEPCATATPVIFGPFATDFLEIGHTITKYGAGFQVAHARALYETLKTLLNDAALRKKMGSNGLTVIQRNQGASQRILKLCLPFIDVNNPIN